MPRVSQPDRWRLSLNESPSEKEGKLLRRMGAQSFVASPQ